MKTDRLERLERLRDQLTAWLDEPQCSDRAQLSLRLMNVLEQIDSLTPAAKVGDPIDEIAQRRAARGAGTAKSRRHAAVDSG